jgi:hypothetical protein
VEQPNGNGNGERKPLVSTLTLTFEHDTFHLEVKGEAPRMDVFMAMLQQAERYFEGQLRAQAALQLQRQVMEQARTEQIIRSVAH